MTRQISESDWKVFRQVQAQALERFCKRVLSDVGELAAEAGKTAHERYLKLFKLLNRRDKQLGEAFDDLRRSAAWRQIAVMRSRGLLTDEEFARFSPETQEAVGVWLSL
jgi:hypothetical protein